MVLVSPIGRRLEVMFGSDAFFFICIRCVAVSVGGSGLLVVYASWNLLYSRGCTAVMCDSKECVMPSGPEVFRMPSCTEVLLARSATG